MSDHDLLDYDDVPTDVQNTNGALDFNEDTLDANFEADGNALAEDGNLDNKDGVNKGSYAGVNAVGFRDFLLRKELTRAVTDAGFEHPSEVQQLCIPRCLLGKDILCQAKSGMGKTAVFVLSVLHLVDYSADAVSAVILCHTRELAHQIKDEFNRFGRYLPEMRVEAFYGGANIDDQKKTLKGSKSPHIYVGTPGRTNALIRDGSLKLDKVKLFVLDECDKMLDQHDMRSEVQSIFRATPKNKQVMMFSATMSNDTRDTCQRFLRNPFKVFIDDDSKLTLHGLIQHFIKLEDSGKNRQLNNLLDTLEFNQIVIFVNSVNRAKALHLLLNECGFPAICIHRDLTQDERLKRFNEFKNFEKRILVSTDVFGRGIDIERINIVVNYDVPPNPDTYLHRVARAGRFGTKGLAITFVANESDVELLNEIQSRFEVSITPLPDAVDVSTYMNA